MSEATNWGLYDSEDDGSDDRESYVTNEGKCSGCGADLDLDDLSPLCFEVEESGIQPGTVDGPAVHWATGTIRCPNCKGRLPFEVSS